LFFNNVAQISAPELEKYSNTSLFDLNNSACFNVSGEWIGEEIQYDPTQSFIKVKFKVIFKLKQEGNRVYGTSYIEDKYRGSHGDMKIRGMVSGNKLYFEEYEIVNEKFFEKNVVWCLRSGEMDIKINESVAILEGLHYNGYASDTYYKCTDYVKMSVSKNLIPEGNSNSNDLVTTDKKILDGNSFAKMEMLIFPNPCVDQATISYELKENLKVQIDVFSLSGAHILNIVNNQQSVGKQNIQFNLSAYVPGVYLVRLQAGNLFSTKQIIKTQ
jgi:hypothetical protein